MKLKFNKLKIKIKINATNKNPIPIPTTEIKNVTKKLNISIYFHLLLFLVWALP